MTKLFFAVLCLIGLVGALPNLAVAADKIRISVTNFNMSFLPQVWRLKEAFSKRKALRRKSFG